MKKPKPGSGDKYANLAGALKEKSAKDPKGFLASRKKKRFQKPAAKPAY